MLNINNIVSDPTTMQEYRALLKTRPHCITNYTQTAGKVTYFVRGDDFKKIITPAEFEEFILSYPDYKIEDTNIHNHNVIHIASVAGNFELVKHILDKYGNHLANLVDSDGWSPLIFAGCCSNKENGFKVGQVLINAGCNINSITGHWCSDSVLGTFHEFSTALGVCVYRSNIKLASLLILKGAVLYYPYEDDIKKITEILKMLMLLQMKETIE